MKKIFLFVLTSALTFCAWSKNFDVVVPYAPGGTADRIALTLLPWLKKELASSDLAPVISYRAGGGSVIGSASVAKSPPGKLQLLLVSNSVVTGPIVNPQAVSYDLVTDFVMLDYLGHVPMLMVVNTAAPVRDIRDFQQWCREKPVSYGSSGIGSATHIVSAMIVDFLQCQSVHVPYKGLGQAMADLQGNHIDFVVDFVSSVNPYIQAGTFRTILSVDRGRNSLYPKTPSVTDIGLNNWSFYNWFVILANASAAESELSVVRTALNKLSKNLDLQQQLQDLGLRSSNLRWDQQFLSRESTNFAKILKNIPR